MRVAFVKKKALIQHCLTLRVGAMGLELLKAYSGLEASCVQRHCMKAVLLERTLLHLEGASCILMYIVGSPIHIVGCSAHKQFLVNGYMDSSEVRM